MDNLPELQSGLLDPTTLDVLFADLEAFTNVYEIVVKSGRDRHSSPQQVDLATARELFISGVARGIQIRYRYQDSDWWDTLINTPNGPRLTRIQHDFASAVVGRDTGES